MLLLLPPLTLMLQGAASMQFMHDRQCGVPLLFVGCAAMQSCKRNTSASPAFTQLQGRDALLPTCC